VRASFSTRRHGEHGGNAERAKNWYSPRFLRVLCVSALSLTVACVKPTPLQVLGEVPQFTLVAETGQPFDSRTMDGHVWVADFIFTTCDGPCPMMSSTMRRLQDQTATEFPELRFVSFTVDPARDTPPVMAEYAKRYRRDPNRWFFLTGDQAALHNLSLDGFKLQSVDGSMTHSTRFVLVDRQRRIRGYYVTGEDGFQARLVHDIRQLSREKS
jgi:protein SCO1/2